MNVPAPDQIKTEEDVEAVIEMLMAKAKQLSNEAQSYGFVLTIGTYPKQPLAMGNYGMQCELRLSHEVYRSES